MQLSVGDVWGRTWTNKREAVRICGKSIPSKDTKSKYRDFLLRCLKVVSWEEKPSMRILIPWREKGSEGNKIREGKQLWESVRVARKELQPNSIGKLSYRKWTPRLVPSWSSLWYFSVSHEWRICSQTADY